MLRDEEYLLAFASAETADLRKLMNTDPLLGEKQSTPRGESVNIKSHSKARAHLFSTCNLDLDASVCNLRTEGDRARI